MSSIESEIITLSASTSILNWVKRLIKDRSSGFGLEVNTVIDIKTNVHEHKQVTISNATKCSINNHTCLIYTRYWHFREHFDEEQGTRIQ